MLLGSFVNKKNSIIVLAFLLFPINLMALYPEKSAYNYQSDSLGIYAGLKVGNTISNSFGKPTGYGYGALWLPTEMLDSGLFGVNLGISFFKYFRVEAESVFMTQRYKILSDSRLFTQEVDAKKFPSYGQESLSGTAIANFYYDIKNFSNIIYPYIGVGLGYGTVKFFWVDENMQPNGMGEKYFGEKKTMFQQAMLGLEYETKIFRSAVFLEYRVVYARGIDLYPANDGTSFASTASTAEAPFPPANYVKPGIKKVNFLNHGFVFGMKFYLY